MKEILKNMILQSSDKAISYADYINTALYHPEKGYYMKHKTKIGTEGDFYTSSNVHTVFGKILADVIQHVFEKGKLPFHVCEVGGGDGRLARAILHEWKTNSPEIYENVCYEMIEISPFHQELQKEQLREHFNFNHYSTVAELKQKYPTFHGVVFSNELFDAFPVHVIEVKNKKLFEVMVSLNDQGDLIERLIPCQNNRIINWLNEMEYNLLEGQRIEIPLAMIEWINEISEWLERGMMLSVDYGYSKEEWRDPVHKEGSLRGYYQHKMVNNPLDYPGLMDLTTHIHFDAVDHFGKLAGFRSLGRLRQDKFLLRAGILKYLQENYDPNPFSETSKLNRAIRTLVAGTGISTAFHVLFHTKGLDELTLDDFLEPLKE